MAVVGYLIGGKGKEELVGAQRLVRNLFLALRAALEAEAEAEPRSERATERKRVRQS